MGPQIPVVSKHRYVERYELFGQDNWEQNKPSDPSADVSDREIYKIVKLFPVDTWREEAEQ